MKVVTGLDTFPSGLELTALALGMFDGLHLGHQVVLNACLDSASGPGQRAGVLTFWPHPSHLLRPGAAVPQIMSLDSKLWALERMGFHAAVVQPFDAGFSAWEAHDFVRQLKRRIPGLRRLFAGENYRFGRGRLGEIRQLEGWAAEEGVEVISIESCSVGGDVVSSTRIRNLILEGRFEDALALLGRPYPLVGPVIKGRQIGRTIGFPTLNVAWNASLPIPYGVYAATVCGVNAGRPAPAVVHFGVRPTFESAGVALLEAHVLEPTSLGYGDWVAVECRRFIRPEKAFDSADALVAQIRHDREVAGNFLAHRP
jgi:riboflavin kinase/FMN adenylyltransferase